MPVKAGFVSIIGKPNVGKSTLMNALIGEKLSITTSKPQTTRKKIIGILSAEDYSGYTWNFESRISPSRKNA